MLQEKTVAEIERLLAEASLSQRKIAALTGVCRGTVSAIACGKRPAYELRSSADGEDQPAGPAARCPGCGGMVYMPCRLCRVRKQMANEPRPSRQRPALQPDVSADLDLRPEHRARYEEVRALRREYRDCLTGERIGT